MKRLFSPPFVDLLAAKLEPGGLLHVKSDVSDYAAYVRYLVEGQGAFGANNPALGRAHRRHQHPPTVSTGARCTASRCSPTTSCATKRGKGGSVRRAAPPPHLQEVPTVRDATW